MYLDLIFAQVAPTLLKFTLTEVINISGYLECSSSPGASDWNFSW